MTASTVMRLTRKISVAPRVLALILVAASPALGQEGVSQVKAEIRRLQKSLKDNPVSGPNVAGLVSATRAALNAATQDLAAGRLNLSMEQLGRAESLSAVSLNPSRGSGS